MQLFRCRSCKREDFTQDQMKKEKKLLINNKGSCKPCHSYYNKNNARIKKAEENPEKFSTCDDCDGIFTTNKRGNHKGNNQYLKNNRTKIVPKVECPFCKSKNISKF